MLPLPCCCWSTLYQQLKPLMATIAKNVPDRYKGSTPSSAEQIEGNACS